jgi:arylsulfatase A-like enzyme
VVAAQALLCILFTVCTLRMLLRNAATNPTVANEISRSYTWFTVEYFAWILAGYVAIGLIMGSLSWLTLWSWSSTFNRRPSARLAAIWTVVLIVVIFSYMTVSCAHYSPQILENVWSSDQGVQWIAGLGALFPSWSLAILRGTFEALVCVLLVAGLVCTIRRLAPLRRRRAITLAATLPVIAAGLGLGLALEQLPVKPRHDDRPNILILATDGLRPDHLGVYGYCRPTSPNIDHLAAESSRFTQCYVPLARTLESWGSIMTGAYPHTHGLRYTWPRETHVPVTLPTLCNELRKKGYASYVLGDWAAGDFAKADFGFDVVKVGPEAWNLKTWITQGACQGHPLLVAFGDNPLGHALYPAMDGMPVNPNPEALTQRATSTLEDLAHSRQPFMMVVFYSETHLPYATRFPYYTRFSDPNYHGPHKLCINVPGMEVVGGGSFKAQDFFNARQLRDLYDGAVLSFDDQVGEVVKTLKGLNLWNDTIVIITTDHGENLLEEPTSDWGHGRFCFGDDYDKRIPLIISDPADRGRPRAIGELMSTLDIMPTLLERVGLPSPTTCEGRSLLDLLRGQRREHSGTIFAETGTLLGGDSELDSDHYLRYPPLIKTLEITDPESGQIGIKKEYLDPMIEARHRMIRTPEWKLVYMPLVDGAKYELFDVRNDPGCHTDVKAAHPEVFSDLKSQLWTWMKKDPLRQEKGEHLVRR